MSEPPSPPDHGWSLCEAAAALFPAEWRAATLSVADMAAGAHSDIAPLDDLFAGPPTEQGRLIAAAAGARDHGLADAVAIPSGDDGEDEAMSARIAAVRRRLAGLRRDGAMVEAALVARDSARDSLPRLFADRMLRGDLLAWGVNMAAGIHAPPTLISPHLWGVARAHFGFERRFVAGTVTGLPGGVTLHAVRIKAARPAPQPASGQTLAEATDRAPATTTIAAERRLEKWLADRMRENRERPPGKEIIKAQAAAAGHSFSERGFARAYAAAAKAAEAPAWTAPGRKSKRRIETAD